VTGSSTEPNRLRHGYTNATSLAGATTVKGRTVVKRYLGPDPVRRRACEVGALTLLAGHFPVPPLIESDDSHVVLGFVPGRPGQEILEERPHEVLFGVGRAGRALHELDLGAAYEVSDGSVLVHGDFGPQNMLFDNATLQVTALVDWEFAHAGDPVEDLAWAEWIVRMHHPHLAKQLDALFDGYGHRPAWLRRHNAMLEKCRWALDFVRRWPKINAQSVAMWEERLDASARFQE
jgi:tRNA A-37 threonylcarbamoyl transferase component Bud32